MQGKHKVSRARACLLGVLKICANLQACYEKGKEVIVVPKTTASSDSPWFGLAIYAWSG